MTESSGASGIRSPVSLRARENSCRLAHMSKRTSCCCDLEELLVPGFFKSLCDPNRLALVARLARCPGPCTVSELAEFLGVDLSVASRHLSLLRDAGVLESERRGKEVRYKVCCTRIVGTLRSIADAIEACCRSNEKPTKRSRQKETS